jgi:hypothetical protein
LSRRSADAGAGTWPGAAAGRTRGHGPNQDVARDAEDPRGRCIVVGGVGGEAPAPLERARVGLDHQVDGQLRVVGAPREEDEQPAPVALVGGGEAIGIQALTGHPKRSCPKAGSCDAARYA